MEIKTKTDLNLVFKQTEIIEVINQPEQFQTSLRKATSNHPILSEILESLEKIDFENIENNRENINQETQDKKAPLDDEEKAAIIIEKILQITDESGLGIGVEDEIIFIYNRNYWDILDNKLFKSFLSECAHRCGLTKWKSRKKRTNDLLFNQFLFSAPIYNNVTKSNIIKINLLNGTFEIDGKEGTQKSELREADKNDFFKYQLAFNYDSKAKAPLFQKFLDDVLPDEASQYALMEYAGYLFTKHLKLEKVLILYGPGGNGKSVFFEVLTALLGDSNVSYFSMNKLCDDQGYYRAKLQSKILNYASEFGGKMDIQTFKRLVSGEPVDARLPYGDPFTLTDYCKFIFNANKLPEVEHTDAFFRRPLIIPLTKKIQESEKDIHLSKKIIENELAGVFNWLLAGLDRLLLNGDFTNSDLINKELEKYKRDSNSVSLFVDEEKYKPSLTKKITLQDLYSSYKRYCEDSNLKAFSRPNFSKKMKEMNFTIAPGTGNAYFVWAENNYPQVEIINPSNLNDILSIFKS